MRNMLVVAGGVVAVAAIVVGVYFGTRPNSSPPPVAVAQTPDKKSLLEVQPGDHVLGDAKAPVTIIEYASLTCSHCASFHLQVLPELKKRHIDTGKVKLVYRDYPLDQVAARAAQVAECAGKDRYFGFLDIMFRGQNVWATAQDPMAELAKSLRIGGMGENEIKACLANEAVANGVTADFKSGETLGVNSTPTLFIGGSMYRGSRSIDDLDREIAKHIK